MQTCTALKTRTLCLIQEHTETKDSQDIRTLEEGRRQQESWRCDFFFFKWTIPDKLFLHHSLACQSTEAIQSGSERYVCHEVLSDPILRDESERLWHVSYNDLVLLSSPGIHRNVRSFFKTHCLDLCFLSFKRKIPGFLRAMMIKINSPVLQCCFFITSDSW